MVLIDQNPNSFNSFCNLLDRFGEKGYERIEIAKNKDGYCSPNVISSPGLIEYIFRRIFRFKQQSVQLKYVGNFSLVWLRANAMHDNEKFYQNISGIEKLKPLMEKAGLKRDFEELISKVKTKYSNPNTNYQLQFPKDFKKADEFEPRIKWILSQFLSNPGTTIERVKKTVRVILNIPTIGTVTVDFSEKIDFYMEGSISQRRIIIKTKEIIGKGSEKKVLRAFDLLTGEELASKPCGYWERLIAQYSDQNKLEGFVPLITFRNDKRLYEKRCETLATYFSADFSARFRFIGELLKALSKMHGLFSSDVQFTHRTNSETYVTKAAKVSFYHGDIKPENILIFKDSNGISRAALSDFGTACEIGSYSYTNFYRSPEKVCFREKEFKKSSLSSETDQLGKHHLTYGQSNDVWSLGLVLINLITGGDRVPDTPEMLCIPNLACFEKNINLHKTSQKNGDTPPDIWVQNLTQNEIDASIDQLANKHSKTSILLCDLIKMMLQVDPQKRITADNALTQFQILSKFIILPV